MAGPITGISRNGIPIAYTLETIKGIEYAFFPAVVGSYQVVYNVDLTAPVITNVAAVVQANGTATISWTTDSLATSRVDYGTSAVSLTQNVSSAVFTTSHSLQLTRPAAGTHLSLPGDLAGPGRQRGGRPEQRPEPAHVHDSAADHVDRERVAA